MQSTLTITMFGWRFGRRGPPFAEATDDAAPAPAEGRSMSPSSLPPAMAAEDPSDQGRPGSDRSSTPGRTLRIGVEAHVVNSRPSGNGRVVANLVDAMARVSAHRFFVYVTDPEVARS